MNNSFNASELLKYVKEMQPKMQKAHETLGQINIIGLAGHEEAFVKVEMNGKYEANVKVTAKLLSSLLKEAAVPLNRLEEVAAILSGITTAAMHDAVQKLNQLFTQHLKELASNVPPNLVNANLNTNQLDLNELLKHLQAVQSEVQKSHETLGKMNIIGLAGHEEESVKVEMNGKYEANATVTAQLLASLLRETPLSVNHLEKVANTLSEMTTVAIKDAVQKLQQKLRELSVDIQPNLIDTAH
jgi:DNA-binding protein YbaB